MSEDHYATLQVHQSAEPMVIEAAYRRLSRAYHPDVNTSPDAHQKMTALNAAYEVLSNVARRRAYDATTRPSASKPTVQPPDEIVKLRQQVKAAEAAGIKSDQEKRRIERYKQRIAEWEAGTVQAGRTPSPPTPPHEPPAPTYTPPSRSGVTLPIAPCPADYGIGANYFLQAVEGAKAWKMRKKALPKALSVTIRVASWIAGLSLFGICLTDWGKYLFIIPYYGWIMVPVMVESVIAGIEARHDKGLRDYEFDPKYNPNPAGWAEYALEVAKWENQKEEVYIPNSGYCFHRNKWCSSMRSPREVPKYLAEAKGYTACSHCGHFSLRPKVLPHPFGPGKMPDC